MTGSRGLWGKEVAVGYDDSCRETYDPGVLGPTVDFMAALLIAAGNGIALQSQLEPEGATVSHLAGQLAGLLLAASAGSEHGADR